MVRILTMLLFIALLLSSSVSCQSASLQDKAAISAAEGWLALNDGGNYAASWREAASYFRNAVTEKSWEGAMESFRKPLGKLISRRIARAKESHSLPGAPDGKYVVMLFKTSFEKKKSAAETVTFMLDSDGKWRAVGYYIR